MSSRTDPILVPPARRRCCAQGANSLPRSAGARRHLRLQRHALSRRADPGRDLPGALRRAREAPVHPGVRRRARRPLRPGDRAHLARRRASRPRRRRPRARRALWEIVADGSTVPDHIREVVRWTAARVPVAVVSGAARAELEPVLRASGLAPYINRQRSCIAAVDWPTARSARSGRTRRPPGRAPPGRHFAVALKRPSLPVWKRVRELQRRHVHPRGLAPPSNTIVGVRTAAKCSFGSQ